jgi:hypothetical protein
MSDINNYDDHGAALAEKDAEIERLQDVIDRVEKAWLSIEGISWDGDVGDAMAQAVKEIDRLRKAVIHWRKARRSCIEAGDMMKEEIDRLRERITNALDALNDDNISGATLILYEGVRKNA